MTEAELQIQVADYLRLQYPDVLFHSDFGSGVKLTPGQAKKQKRQNGGRRAWPDIFIAEPRRTFMKHRTFSLEYGNSATHHAPKYSGLFIELKKEGTRLRKVRTGDWVNEHIEEQAEMLQKLYTKGYFAAFACGFEDAKRLIDDYLEGE